MMNQKTRPDFLRTAVIQGLRYLMEKYPGLIHCSESDSLSLRFRVHCAFVTWKRFGINVRTKLPDDFGWWTSIEPPDGRFTIVHTDPLVFSTAYDYFVALSGRYPDQPIELEEHLPVLEELICRTMRWDVVPRPFSEKYYREGNELSEMATKFGWGNGYVGVPEGHPWFGVPYDEINVGVHGGLTYGSDHFPRKEEPKKDGLWWVGFDTRHYNDDFDRWPKEAVREETQYLFLKAAWAWAGIENPMHS